MKANGHLLTKLAMGAEERLGLSPASVCQGKGELQNPVKLGGDGHARVGVVRGFSVSC